MTTLAQNDFTSIGQLAGRLRRSVRQIEAAAIELNIQPALRLNYVPHFSGDQIELLTARLADTVTNPLPQVGAVAPELRRP